MIGLLKQLFCLHRWIDIETFQKLRISDGKPFALTVHQRCEKCGEHRMHHV